MVRRVSGIEPLCLRPSELGSFAMPREWTDWAPPNAQVTSAGGQPLITDAFGLLALKDLVCVPWISGAQSDIEAKGGFLYTGGGPLGLT
jgi:hypothetical protein